RAARRQPGPPAVRAEYQRPRHHLSDLRRRFPGARFRAALLLRSPDCEPDRADSDRRAARRDTTHLDSLPAAPGLVEAAGAAPGDLRRSGFWGLPAAAAPRVRPLGGGAGRRDLRADRAAHGEPDLG